MCFPPVRGFLAWAAPERDLGAEISAKADLGVEEEQIEARAAAADGARALAPHESRLDEELVEEEGRDHDEEGDDDGRQHHLERKVRHVHHPCRRVALLRADNKERSPDKIVTLEGCVSRASCSYCPWVRVPVTATMTAHCPSLRRARGAQGGRRRSASVHRQRLLPLDGQRQGQRRHCGG